MDELNIEQLILDGVLEVAGIDSESGEMLYNFTPDLQEKIPELYKAHTQWVHQEIMYFWEHGFLNMNNIFTDNPTVYLSAKAFDDEALSKLDPDKRFALQQIKHILKMI